MQLATTVQPVWGASFKITNLSNFLKCLENMVVGFVLAKFSKLSCISILCAHQRMIPYIKNWFNFFLSLFPHNNCQTEITTYENK